MIAADIRALNIGSSATWQSGILYIISLLLRGCHHEPDIYPSQPGDNGDLETNENNAKQRRQLVLSKRGRLV